MSKLKSYISECVPGVMSCVHCTVMRKFRGKICRKVYLILLQYCKQMYSNKISRVYNVYKVICYIIVYKSGTVCKVHNANTEV